MIITRTVSYYTWFGARQTLDKTQLPYCQGCYVKQIWINHNNTATCIFHGTYFSCVCCHETLVPMMTSSNVILFRVTGDQRSPVDSPHKGQWRGALAFSLICAWTNNWNGDLRRHHAHYDVIVMRWKEAALIRLDTCVKTVPISKAPAGFLCTDHERVSQKVYWLNSNDIKILLAYILFLMIQSGDKIAQTTTAIVS